MGADGVFILRRAQDERGVGVWRSVGVDRATARVPGSGPLPLVAVLMWCRRTLGGCEVPGDRSLTVAARIRFEG